MLRRFPATLLAAVLSCAAPSAGPRADRPNIVLILADDMGWSDAGCYGSEIRTPAIDGLAARGMRLTQFYNAARCCPTRASLLTGLYAHQAGVGHMVEDRGHPGYRGHLNDRCVTLAEVLRAAGYGTYMSGKWHVGEAPGRQPTDRGFERYFGLLGGGSNYFELERGRTMMSDGAPWAPPPGRPFYMTDAFTDAALRFIDDATSHARPFFLYLAFTAPHWPLQALPEDIELYRDAYAAGWDVVRQERARRGVERGVLDARWALSDRDERVPPWESAKDRDLEARKMAVYAAMVHRMDVGIGRVLETLRSKGVAENTLVVFLSDNGASPEEYPRVTPAIPPGSRESFHTAGPPWANASNAPFRLHKRAAHEGGISTPFIASWPAVIRPGSLSSEPAHLVDLMATFAEAGRAAYPHTFGGRDVLPLEGRSLMPVLRGGRLGERPLFWEHEGHRAVRRGRWKLVARHAGPWELYDMQDDRTETRDLAAREPERVRAMAAEWDAWAARVGVLPFEKVLPPGK